MGGERGHQPGLPRGHGQEARDTLMRLSEAGATITLLGVNFRGVGRWAEGRWAGRRGVEGAEDIGHIEKNLSECLRSKTSFKTLMSEELA